MVLKQHMFSTATINFLPRNRFVQAEHDGKACRLRVPVRHIARPEHRQPPGRPAHGVRQQADQNRARQQPQHRPAETGRHQRARRQYLSIF